MEATKSTTENLCAHSVTIVVNMEQCEKEKFKISIEIVKQTSSSDETKLITSIFVEYCHNNLNGESKNHIQNEDTFKKIHTHALLFHESIFFFEV